MASTTGRDQATSGRLGPRLLNMSSEPCGSQRSLAVHRSCTSAAIMRRQRRAQSPDKEMRSPTWAEDPVIRPDNGSRQGNKACPVAWPPHTDRA